MNRSVKKEAYDYGLRAEAQAITYFTLKGFRVIARRHRNQYGEIDLIVKKDNRLHFVEVKARQSIDASLYALQPKQQQRIARAAQGFVADHPQYQLCDMQIDLIAIAGWQIRYEPNIVVGE